MKDNIIYDGHSYPPSVSRMLYFRSVALLMGNIPLYIGEFNSGFKNGTTLTENQVDEYVDRFKAFGIYGWAMWRWSYIQDQNIPAFNLTTIVDSRIQPGIYFNYLIKCIRDIEWSEVNDDICNSYAKQIRKSKNKNFFYFYILLQEYGETVSTNHDLSNLN